MVHRSLGELGVHLLEGGMALVLVVLGVLDH